MNFNFYDEYSNYSTIELLKILKQPDNYQVAAIDTATQILKNREILETDVQEIEKYFQDIQTNEQLKKEKIDSYKEKASDFLQPILKPAAEVKPIKWLNIFFAIVGLQYLWTIYTSIKNIIFFFICKTCSFEIAIVLTFINLLYIPVIFYFLLKKKRWGWILLFADNLFALIFRISESFIFFRYYGIHYYGTSSFLFPTFIKTAFVFFLWREEIAQFFKVTNDTKKKTALITTFGTLLLIGTLYLVYR